MKKSVLLLVGALVLVGCIAGCGSISSDNSSTVQSAGITLPEVFSLSTPNMTDSTANDNVQTAYGLFNSHIPIAFDLLSPFKDTTANVVGSEYTWTVVSDNVTLALKAVILNNDTNTWILKATGTGSIYYFGVTTYNQTTLLAATMNNVIASGGELITYMISPNEPWLILKWPDTTEASIEDYQVWKYSMNKNNNVGTVNYTSSYPAYNWQINYTDNGLHGHQLDSTQNVVLSW